MAAPTYAATGTVQQGTGALTVPWPPGHVANQVALLFVETANEVATLSTPAGFVEVTNSPQGNGTGGQAAATRLTVFWCRATSGAMASPVVADSGARQTAFIMTFDGCILTGNPWDVTAGSNAAATATVTFPTVTTTVVDTLVVLAATNGLLVGDTTVRAASLANANLANLTKRANTQPDGTGGGGVSPNFLRVGPFSTTANPGDGPGNDAVGPKWGILKRNPTPTNINAMIDAADANDVLLMLNLAGSKPGYKDASGQLNIDLYEGKVARFDGNAKLIDALARRRAVIYVLDEPNIANANAPGGVDLSPDLTNQFAGVCKTHFPGALTFVRLAPTFFNSGWGGFPKLAGGYTKVDYGWMQYNPKTAREAQTVAQSLSLERTVAAQLNMGVGVSLNIFAGGIPFDTDGVTAKWNTNGAGGNFGYILGDREAAEATFVASIPSNPVPSLMASPAWVQHFCEAVAQDNVAPFCMLWEDAAAAGSSSGPFSSFWLRADMIAAMEAGIAAGAARSSWVGWRAAK